MSKFADILAMSKAHTAANDAAVQSAISQREAKLQAEKEAAERRHKIEMERQEKMRQAQAQAEKREAEKARLREQAVRAREQEAERKQQAQMEKFMGKTRHQMFENRQKEGGRHTPNGRQRKQDNGSDEEEVVDGGQVLTRAEKRALKMDPDARPAWAQRLIGSSAPPSSKEPRASSATPHSRTPVKAKRLKHPEAEFTNYLSAPSSLASQGDQSLPIKERLKTSDYFVPIKLSAVRRDTRTQADYFQEKRQRALAANGDWNQDLLPDRKRKSKPEGGSGSDSTSKVALGGDRPAKPLIGVGSSRSTLTSTTNKASMASSRNDSPSGTVRKRQRSESISSSDLDSDTPRKRTKQSSTQSALREEIWRLMSGKSRSHYADDVFSDDDEVMEVSMRDVAKEEARRLVFFDTFRGLSCSF